MSIFFTLYILIVVLFQVTTGYVMYYSIHDPSKISFIDKDSMTKLLSSLKLKSTIIQKYMTGVIVK